MTNRFLIFFCACSLLVGAVSNPANMNNFNSTARGIIYNSCMPVVIEELKEEGKDDPTSIANFICKAVSLICSNTEKFAGDKKRCTKSLKKYDEALRNSGSSLLHGAAYYGRTDLAKVLIDVGVDLDMQQQGVGSTAFGKGWTPLMLAAAEGHNDVVFYLIQVGADVNAKNEFGRTSLMFSANYGFFEIAEMLLENGASTDDVANDESGWSAIIAAAFNGHRDLVKLLLEHGADQNIRDTSGKTALMWAEEQGHRKVARTLERSQ